MGSFEMSGNGSDDQSTPDQPDIYNLDASGFAVRDTGDDTYGELDWGRVSESGFGLPSISVPLEDGDCWPL